MRTYKITFRHEGTPMESCMVQAQNWHEAREKAYTMQSPEKGYTTIQIKHIPKPTKRKTEPER